MSAQPQSQKNLGILKLTSYLLDYLKYGRLMWLMMIFGGFGGVAYFVFSPALYESKSIIDLKIYALPISSDGLDSGARMQRNLLNQLGSRQMIAGAAHRMGIAPETASFEELRTRQLRKVTVSMLDWSTLQIVVISEDPAIVRDFPKAMIEHYEVYQKELRVAFMEAAMQKYLDELEALKQRIGDKLKKQADFTRENSVAELLIEQNALAQVPLDILKIQHRLGRYDDVAKIISERGQTLSPLEELSLLESAKTAALEESRLGAVLQATGDVGTALSTTLAVAARPSTLVVQPQMIDGLRPWQELEKSIRSIEVEIQESLRTYLEDHQIVKELRNRLRQQEEALTAELDVERKAFLVDKTRLQDELAQLQKKLPEYTSFTEKVNKLRSDYTLDQEGDLAWTQAYTELAKRVTTMEFGADKDRVDLSWKSYTLLRDVDPISPTKSKLLMMALALGLGLAAGVPFCMEQLNGRVVQLERLELATGYKGIGIVPKTESAFLEEVVRPNEEATLRPNNVLECFRLIRAHLSLDVQPRAGRRARVILCTSARPSEGKTSLAANLSWAFQSMGQKVLLVDMDFRRGRVHRLFKEKAGPGLCQALTREIPLKDVIRSAVAPLWDYIPRGNTVAGSSELLCRLDVETVVDNLAEHYDWIILDTPPVLGLSETVGLQRLADACIVVARCNIALTRDVVDAITRLEKAGAKLAGFVLNEVDLSKISNYYYYYYSSAHYYNQFDEPSAPADGRVPSPA
jgi:succinoglycan biosynthesis transport protein ExoP